MEKRGIPGLVADSLKQLQEAEHSSDDTSLSKEKDEQVQERTPSPLGEDAFIAWFSDVTRKDSERVGEKGSFLGELSRARFPVPSGFIITTAAFESFLERVDIRERIRDLIDQTNENDSSSLDATSRAIRELVESKEFPRAFENQILEAYHFLGDEKIDARGVSTDALTILKNAQEPIFVSIRASVFSPGSDSSPLGVHESFLNMKGDRRVLSHVKRCFSSLYTPQTILSIKQGGLSRHAMAVIIQKMVDAEKSGVMFSHDLAHDRDAIIIEAVFGLGEGISSGTVVRDMYVVSRDLHVEDATISKKEFAIVRNGSGDTATITLTPEKGASQVLSSGSLAEIADYALKIEDHFGGPQRIEFAVEQGRVFILQSQPFSKPALVAEELDIPLEEERTLDTVQLSVLVDMLGAAERAGTSLLQRGISSVPLQGGVAHSVSQLLHDLEHANSSPKGQTPDSHTHSQRSDDTPRGVIPFTRSNEQSSFRLKKRRRKRNRNRNKHRRESDTVGTPHQNAQVSESVGAIDDINRVSREGKDIQERVTQENKGVVESYTPPAQNNADVLPPKYAEGADMHARDLLNDVSESLGSYTPDAPEEKKQSFRYDFDE